MSEESTIRPVREEDSASIVELLNAIIAAGTYTIMDRPVTEREQAEFLRSFPSRGVFLAAVGKESGRVLAIQDVQPLRADAAVLDHVGEVSTFVALDCRRKGVGRSLSQATFEAARRKGFRKIHASIRADNPGAVAFYEAQGFRTIGVAEAHAFVRGRYVDEVFAELHLGDR